MRVRVVLAVIATALLAILVACMLAVTIWKIATDGWIEYFQHYTNWSWSMQTFWYAGITPSFLIVALEITDWRLTLQCAFIVLFFIPMWSIIVAVWLMVVLMLLTGADFINTIAETVQLSIVILGNEAFHFLTILFFFLVAVVVARIIYFAHNQLYAEPAMHRNRALFWGVVLYQMLFGPMITVLLYLTFFNPQAVYETDINVALGLLFITFAFLVSSSPLLLFIYCFYLGKAPLHPRWLVESEFEAPADRVALTYGKFTYRLN